MTLIILQNHPNLKLTIIQTKPTIFQTKPTIIQTKPTIFQTKPTIIQTKPTIIQTKPTIFQTKKLIPKSSFTKMHDGISLSLNDSLSVYFENVLDDYQDLDKFDAMVYETVGNKKQNDQDRKEMKTRKSFQSTLDDDELNEEVQKILSTLGQSDAQQSDGQQSDGQQSDGQQSDGQQSVSNQKGMTLGKEQWMEEKEYSMGKIDSKLGQLGKRTMDGQSTSSREKVVLRKVQMENREGLTDDYHELEQLWQHTTDETLRRKLFKKVLLRWELRNKQNEENNQSSIANNHPSKGWKRRTPGSGNRNIYSLPTSKESPLKRPVRKHPKTVDKFATHHNAIQSPKNQSKHGNSPPRQSKTNTKLLAQKNFKSFEKMMDVKTVDLDDFDSILSTPTTEKMTSGYPLSDLLHSKCHLKIHELQNQLELERQEHLQEINNLKTKYTKEIKSYSSKYNHIKGELNAEIERNQYLEGKNRDLVQELTKKRAQGLTEAVRFQSELSKQENHFNDTIQELKKDIQPKELIEQILNYLQSGEIPPTSLLQPILQEIDKLKNSINDEKNRLNENYEKHMEQSNVVIEQLKTELKSEIQKYKRGKE